MNNRLVKQRYGKVHTACAVCFAIFVFCFIFFYQHDMLALGQHVLSGGATTFNRIVASVLLTLALMIVQRFVASATKVWGMAHAITYLPSLLILTILTDVSPEIVTGVSLGVWGWLMPLVLIAFAFMVYVARQLQPMDNEEGKVEWFSKPMWMNIFALVVMFVAMGCLSSSNDVFHYRLRMERLLIQGEPQKALEVGKNVDATDSSLTMLRIHTLAITKQMGEHLFEYPIVGEEKAMVPDGKGVSTLMLSKEVVKAVADSLGKSSDYALARLLLMKDLPSFYRRMLTVYNDSDMIPKHFKEALALYRTRYNDGNGQLADSVMDAKYKLMDHAIMKCKTKEEKFTRMKNEYSNTYWFYYRYE